MDAAITTELLRLSAWALIGVALVSVGAAVAGRWEFGRRAARVAVLGMLVYPVLAVLLILNSSPHETVNRATALAQVISHTMNGAPAGIGAAVVWIDGNRRKRRERIG